MTLRCLIWIAVSSEAQANEDEKISLPHQEATARALCEKEGWYIVDVLRVPGHSRDYVDIHECSRDMQKQGIDAFAKLMTYWDQRAFDVLICRDSERFARTQTLQSYVVERTILSGASIYSLADGWVNETNYRMFIAMAGYKASSDIDRLKKAYQAAAPERAKRGLPAGGSRVIFSHKLIRNDLGKGERLEVDETYRALWNDVATLLLEGVSWNTLGRELYARFGHVGLNGKAWSYSDLHRVLHTPIFWGHVARHYSYSKKQRRKSVYAGLWMIEDGHELPEGVTIWYNTHPPVYTGTQADAVKAELRRRYEVARGSASPRNTHRFSGIFICAECGYGMNYVKNGKQRYLRCMSRYFLPHHTPRCTQTRRLSLKRAEAHVNDALASWIEQRSFSPIRAQSNESALQQVQDDTRKTENKLKRLIQEQADADEGVQDYYRGEIDTLGKRLKALKKQSDDLRRAQPAPNVIADSQDALNSLREISIEAFWKWEDRVINQLLHRILGQWRFAVEKGEVVRIQKARSRGRRK